MKLRRVIAFFVVLSIPFCAAFADDKGWYPFLNSKGWYPTESSSGSTSSTTTSNNTSDQSAANNAFAPTNLLQPTVNNTLTNNNK